MNLTIRNAAERDFDALIAIGHKFWNFNPYRDVSTLDEGSLRDTLAMLIESHVLVVAEIDEVVIGAAGAFIAPVYWNKSELQGLEFFWWIDPEHRKNSAGRILRYELQTRAQQKGVKFWNMIALEDSMPKEVGEMYVRDGMRLVEHTYMKVI